MGYYSTFPALVLLLALFILSSAVPEALAGDEKFTVLKEPTCSKEKGDGSFPLAVTILLGKLAVETPKHKAKEGGYSYTITNMKIFKQKGGGSASCDDDKGKDKEVSCGPCLGYAGGKLTAKCGDKTSGDVELKGCKISFKQE